VNPTTETQEHLPTLDDVYRKFGETSEAAQLLETSFGTKLLWVHCVDAGLVAEPDRKRAAAILDKIDRQTLGQLIKNVNRKTASLDELEVLLSKALEERNRLSHTFYRQHNFRRNSGEGRTLMMEDLEAIHTTLLDAFKAITLLFDGIDLEAEVAAGNLILPTRHVPI
jgi:hypothetical protein